MRFAPNWKLSLFVVIFLPLLIALGNWQLRRAEEKRVLESALAAASAQGPVALRADVAPPQHLAAVRIRGRFDGERLVFLDNRTHEGRVGYEVHALLEDARSAGAFVVALGWVPAPRRRDVLPEVRLPRGPLTLHGILLRELPDTPVFGPLAEGTDWPQRVQRLELEHLAQVWDRELFAGLVVADAGEPGVREHVFEPVRMGAATHTGYAVQWFGLAAVLVVGWCVASLKRTRARPEATSRATSRREQ